MGLFDLGGMIGGIASGLGSIGEGLINQRTQKLTNQANIDMNSANNAQNMAITQQQWARDDNSIQRRTADLKAAGLSPVLAAGAGAQSSAPISMQAGKAIAPQMSGLSGAIGGGVSTYADIVRAKELKEQMQAKTDTDNINRNIAKFTAEHVLPTQVSANRAVTRRAEADARVAEHDANYYTRQPIPSELTKSNIGGVMVTRDLVQQYAQKHPGVVPQGLLDFLGGN